MNYLREFNTVSVILRLAMALFLGCILGLDRERKRHAAGMRTYSLVCLGACLTMLISQYLDYMLKGPWAISAAAAGSASS